MTGLIINRLCCNEADVRFDQVRLEQRGWMAGRVSLVWRGRPVIQASEDCEVYRAGGAIQPGQAERVQVEYLAKQVSLTFSSLPNSTSSERIPSSISVQNTHGYLCSFFTRRCSGD